MPTARSSPRSAVVHTPDARYIVVRDRLWRAANPGLAEADRQRHVDALMTARRAVGAARTDEARRVARAEVDAAKRALGERGPVWWTDGAPDENRRMVRNTSYAACYAGLTAIDCPTR